METRDYTPSDFEKLRLWWENHWGAEPSIHVLPRTGVVVSLDGRDIAAAWMYLDDSTPVAFISWVVTNPGNSPLESKRGLEIALKYLVKAGTVTSRQLIIGAAPSGSCSRVFESAGFTPQDSNIEHLTIIT